MNSPSNDVDVPELRATLEREGWLPTETLLALLASHDRLTAQLDSETRLHLKEASKSQALVVELKDEVERLQTALNTRQEFHNLDDLAQIERLRAALTDKEDELRDALNRYEDLHRRFALSAAPAQPNEQAGMQTGITARGRTEREAHDRKAQPEGAADEHQKPCWQQTGALGGVPEWECRECKQRVSRWSYPTHLAHAKECSYSAWPILERAERAEARLAAPQQSDIEAHQGLYAAQPAGAADLGNPREQELFKALSDFLRQWKNRDETTSLHEWHGRMKASAVRAETALNRQPAPTWDCACGEPHCPYCGRRAVETPALQTETEEGGLQVRGSPGMPLETVMATFDVLQERRRQIQQEGWTSAHDDQHDSGQMADAAACYALSGGGNEESLFESFWPWSSSWWKPKDKRRDLVRAGALIIAEIERLDRSAMKAKES